MDRHELRERRKRLGLTQAQLAAALGVSPPTIPRWETGRMEIRQPLMLALALSALECRGAHGHGSEAGNDDHHIPAAPMTPSA